MLSLSVYNSLRCQSIKSSITVIISLMRKGIRFQMNTYTTEKFIPLSIVCVKYSIELLPFSSS